MGERKSNSLRVCLVERLLIRDPMWSTRTGLEANLRFRFTRDPMERVSFPVLQEGFTTHPTVNLVREELVSLSSMPMVKSLIITELCLGHPQTVEEGKRHGTLGSHVKRMVALAEYGKLIRLVQYRQVELRLLSLEGIMNHFHMMTDRQSHDSLPLKIPAPELWYALHLMQPPWLVTMHPRMLKSGVLSIVAPTIT